LNPVSPVKKPDNPDSPAAQSLQVFPGHKANQKRDNFRHKTRQRYRLERFYGTRDDVHGKIVKKMKLFEAKPHL
jgi:hypothetical protein